MTENIDILNKYTISLFLENVVSLNISKVRPINIFPKHLFKTKVASGTCILFP